MIVGVEVVEFIGNYKVDFVVIGVFLMDVDGVILDFDDCEVVVVWVIFKNVCIKIFVVDYIKFDCFVLYWICDVVDLDVVIMD